MVKNVVDPRYEKVYLRFGTALITEYAILGKYGV